MNIQAYYIHSKKKNVIVIHVRYAQIQSYVMSMFLFFLCGRSSEGSERWFSTDHGRLICVLMEIRDKFIHIYIVNASCVARVRANPPLKF